MRVFAIASALGTLALAACGSPPTTQKATSAPPVPAIPAAPTPAMQASMAEPAPQPIADRTGSSTADDNEVVCRKEKLLGTRIGKRVCKTREQLRLEEESARRMMKNRDQKSHGVTDPITGGGG